MFTRRKLRVIDPKVWPHHRAGWTAVVDHLRAQLHADDGTRFVSSVEDMLADGEPPTEPWVGFIHQAPQNGEAWFPDLERIPRHPVWLAALPYCRGVFVLSDYVKQHLRRLGLTVPIARVYYPFAPTTDRFCWDRFRSEGRRLLFVGEYLRDYRAFFELTALGYAKVLLKPDSVDVDHAASAGSVEIRHRVSADEYDWLMSSSVVFLSLIDCPANTTILECVARCTPVLVNPVGAVGEYLGRDYPLYYRSLSEAEALLADEGRLTAAHDYLRTYDGREQLTPERFLLALQSTAIYRALPVPPSQERVFPVYDLSVIVCSYKRVENVPDLLRRFTEQDFPGRFELILWNNAATLREDVERICAPYAEQLHLKTIHSSENFYCVVRQAAASLVASDVLLICDDDVKPGPGYVTHYMAKYREYGPNAVLCCRGHVFRQHHLDEEAPHRIWQEYEHLDFYDESVEDRQVHFMHADSCLIPRSVMLRAVQFEHGVRANNLVDDYWLSFVVSHHLRLPIWKIRADTVLALDPSSDDPTVALFHNPSVREQRVNFYVEHMRAGWPCHVREAPASATAETASPPADLWATGFGGVNMGLRCSDADLAAAAASGVRVIRVGVTGGGNELRALVDPAGDAFVWNAANRGILLGFVERAARHGLAVILALTHVPGRLFGGDEATEDVRIWRDRQFRRALAEMWGVLSEELARFPNVIGYDVLNEPFLPEEVGVPSEQAPLADLAPLLELYTDVVAAIRARSMDRVVILEASQWANPLALPRLEPVPDPRVVYSFHMYLPHVYTDRHKNAGRLCYPGMIPERSYGRRAECRYWDRDELARLLGYVVDWQKDFNLPSSRVYVGEFGVAREARGAVVYLQDLLALFRQAGWSWTAYAFREREWDAMNYELGPDIDNMLDHVRSELFNTLASSFH